MSPIGILATGSCLPSRQIDNDEVGQPAGVDAQWIVSRTGIQTRWWAKPDEATSDLAVMAGRAALHQARISATDLSYVLVATSTPDSPQPPTACTVADLLGARRGTPAFDLNAVCSGFVYALAVGWGLLSLDDAGPALVIAADIYSRSLNRADRRTAVLFGDGAGAAVLGRVSPGRGILATRLLGFGEHRDLIGVPAGGTRVPASYDSVEAGLHYFTMKGRAVREFVVEQIPPAVAALLSETGVAAHEVRHVVPHQANGPMLDDLFERLSFPAAQLHTTVRDQGNTGAASIPSTLDAAARAGRIRAGDFVLLVAFGGGMTAGLALLRW